MLYRFIRTLMTQVVGATCRSCNATISSRDEFGTSEAVCAHCRAA